MRLKKPKDKVAKKEESESESNESSSSSDEEAEDNSSDGDEEKEEDGSQKSSASDGENESDESGGSDNEESNNDSSDQEDTKKDKEEDQEEDGGDSDSNSSGSDSEGDSSDSESTSKADDGQVDDLRSVASSRSMDAGTLTVEGSTLVESRPPSAASQLTQKGISKKQPASEVGGTKTMPSHPTGAHYHRAHHSGSTMAEEAEIEPDADFPTQGRQRRGSLFDIPQGPRRPTITGASVTSSNVPHDEEFNPAQFKPPKKFENTYKLDPERKFTSGKARIIIEEVFEQQLENQTYDPIACSILSQDLSTQIKDRVKRLGYDRYKFVAVVTIGEKKDQGVRIGSRAVWDMDRDTCASVTYENPSIYAVANLYALYFE